MRAIATRALLGAAIAASMLAPGAASAQSSGEASFADFLVGVTPKLEVMSTDASSDGAQAILDYLDANPPHSCYVSIWLDAYALGQLTVMAFADISEADAFVDAMRIYSDRAATDIASASLACGE